MYGKFFYSLKISTKFTVSLQLIECSPIFTKSSKNAEGRVRNFDDYPIAPPNSNDWERLKRQQKAYFDKPVKYERQKRHQVPCHQSQFEQNNHQQMPCNQQKFGQSNDFNGQNNQQQSKQPIQLLNPYPIHQQPQNLGSYNTGYQRQQKNY